MDLDPSVEVVDALAAGSISEAAELAFEYMAATRAEVGWAEPIPMVYMERASDIDV
jgi:hypothetical protein